MVKMGHWWRLIQAASEGRRGRAGWRRVKSGLGRGQAVDRGTVRGAREAGWVGLDVGRGVRRSEQGRRQSFVVRHYRRADESR